MFSPHKGDAFTQLEIRRLPQSELYEARMKQANCLDLTGRSPEAKLHEAAAHHSERAEPFYELALWHVRQIANCSGNAICEAQHHISAYLYAKEVKGLSPKQCSSFVVFVLCSLLTCPANISTSIPVVHSANNWYPVPKYTHRP